MRLFATVCLALSLLVTTLQSGCVRRVMLIRSDPEGALVTVDRQAVGHTPVAVPFTYYGTREIRLEKDGYESIESKQRIRAPWYDWVPISFITNHFSFRELRDNRTFDYTLRPKPITDESALRDRADQMRLDVFRGTVALPLQAEAATDESIQR